MNITLDIDGVPIRVEMTYRFRVLDVLDGENLQQITDGVVGPPVSKEAFQRACQKWTKEHEVTE